MDTRADLETRLDPFSSHSVPEAERAVHERARAADLRFCEGNGHGNGYQVSERLRGRKLPAKYAG